MFDNCTDLLEKESEGVWKLQREGKENKRREGASDGEREGSGYCRKLEYGD